MSPRATAFGYWACVVVGAWLVLAGMSAAATIALRTRHAIMLPRVGRSLDGHVSNKMSTSKTGRAVLLIHRAVPGQAGRRRIVISNVGPRPFTRVTLTQDHLVMGGFSSALQLQVYDAITRRCLYPLELRRYDRCSRWMPFDGRRRIHRLVIPGRGGSTIWKRREQHAIDIRWRLAPWSPNADQGRRASFRLGWDIVG
jgi:hypothetical protein